MNPILRKMQNDSKKHIPGKGKPPLFLPPIQMEPQEAAPPEDLKLVKDIAFKAVQGKPLYMDAVCPDKLPASGNAPVIVYFHGGGMVMGDRTMCPAFRYALARLGYLVYSVDYGFVGEYMREYEFARETEALLIQKMVDK